MRIKMKTIEKHEDESILVLYYEDDAKIDIFGEWFYEGGWIFAIQFLSQLRIMRISWKCKKCGSLIIFDYLYNIKKWLDCYGEEVNPPEYRQDICDECNGFEKFKYLTGCFDELTPEEERVLERLK